MSDGLRDSKTETPDTFLITQEQLSFEQLFNEIVSLRERLASARQERFKMRERTRLLAHDIKTPLANITEVLSELLGPSGVLSSDPGLYTITQLAHTQLEALQVLLVNTLLDPLDNVSPVRFVNTRKTINHIAVILGLDTKAKLELRGNFPEAYLNVSALQSVFLNLLDNAYKSIEAAGGEILIESCVNDAGSWNCNIRDNGVGMSPTALRRFLESSSQSIDNASTRGFGLGLLSAKRLVLNELSGLLSVSSEQGKGTTFYISIPVKQSV